MKTISEKNAAVLSLIERILSSLSKIKILNTRNNQKRFDVILSRMSKLKKVISSQLIPRAFITDYDPALYYNACELSELFNMTSRNIRYYAQRKIIDSVFFNNKVLFLKSYIQYAMQNDPAVIALYEKHKIQKRSYITISLFSRFSDYALCKIRVHERTIPVIMPADSYDDKVKLDELLNYVFENQSFLR